MDNQSRSGRHIMELNQGEADIETETERENR